MSATPSDTPHLVLFVDDDEQVLRGLGQTLFREPYQKLFAASADEALAVLKQYRVHVIVCDLDMPRKDGLTLLREIKEMYPDIIRIVLTGMTQVNQIVASVNSGEIYRYITKPFRLNEDFKPAILNALDTWFLRSENKTLMDELKQKNDELETAVRVRTNELQVAKDLIAKQLEIRTNFLSNIQIEFRNHLKIIIQQMKHLTGVPVDQKHRVEKSFQASVKMLSMLENIITVTPIKEESLFIEHKPFKLSHVARRLVQTTQKLLNPAVDQFTANIRAADGIVCSGYSDLIDKMVMILIEHALNYSNSRQIKFIVKVEKVNKRYRIEFIINSTHEILTPEKKEVIFEEFVRSTAEKDTSVDSLGVGLSLSKYLAQLMGGDIKLYVTERSGYIYQATIELFAA